MVEYNSVHRHTLLLACKIHNYKIAKLVLENGAHPDCPDNEPIIFSVRNGDYEMVKLLLKYKAIIPYERMKEMLINYNIIELLNL